METTASKSESSVLIPSGPEPPVRILVQTLTHLVPGNDGIERDCFILNRMCQYHWNCDFDVPRFRWASYDAHYAFENRRCFFLVDYGESQNDDDVPVLSYEWTGETLKPLPQLAKNPKIQAKLKDELPFTYQRRPPKREKLPTREMIKLRLYSDSHIPPEEIDYMEEHPEDMEWLKTHLKPRLWRKFVDEANAFKPPGAPLMQP